MHYIKKLIINSENWLASEHGKWLTITLALWGGYFFILWPRLLFQKGEEIFAGWIGIYSDWMAHFSYAMPFAFRPATQWFLNHPLYYDYPFMYPFMADAITGILIRFGLDLTSAFIIPSLLTSLFLIVFLFQLYFINLGNSGKLSLLAVTIFFTSGGLGFIEFISNLPESFGTNLYPVQEYTHLASHSIKWLNVITGQLIPQRSLLLGVTIGLYLLIWVYKKWQNDFKQTHFFKTMILGAASGTMVIIHPHSYIALLIFLVAMAAIKIHLWRYYAAFLFGAIAVAVPLYGLFYAHGVNSNWLTWHPGWLSHPNQTDTNFVIFWLRNWGLFLPTAIWGTWRFRLFKNPLVLGAIVIFIISNLFLFQIYPQANDKLLIWAYLILAIPVSRVLHQLWFNPKQTKIFRGVAIALFIALSFSGALDLLHIIHTDKHSYQLWSAGDLVTANKFRKKSAPSDLVLTSGSHNNWASTLTGRQTFMGYQGWLWTYGIDYGARVEEVRKMYHGDPQAKKIIDEHGVDYIVFDQKAGADFSGNESYFRDNYKTIIKNRHYRVYEVAP